MNFCLQGVGKHYVMDREIVAALNGISLSLPKGEVLAVLGSSGAGKTTLFRLLNATMRPSSGSLRLDGRELGTMSSGELRRTRRKIGTIYQKHNLVPSLTALENTLSGCLGRWSLAQTIRSLFRPAKADVQEAMYALEQVELADKWNARADELSGGQQQRVAIARVLMQKPEVILADEPVASLDPALTEGIMSLLLRVGSEGQRTLVVAIHKVELALEFFPRVVGLRRGSLYFDCSATTVDSQLLDGLYAGVRKKVQRIQDDDEFKERFGCAR
jgi:phosphonate transport system ATP-binding protein